MSRKMSSWKRWALQLSLLAAPCMSQAVTLDVLVLYDTHSQNYFNDQPATAIRAWVDQSNTYYQNSQIDVQLRLVGTQLHNPGGSNMSEVLNQVTNDSTVRSRRDSVGADFVAQIHRTGSCGVAWMAVSANYAYSVTGPTCGAYTFAHELGHNMGLNHSRRQGDTKGARYPYALGHGVDGVFATIMTYNQLFGVSRIGKFSNPNVSCNGLPCGVPEGRSDQADAAKSINNVRAEMANFRPTKTTGGGGGDGGGTTTPTVAAYLLKVKHTGKCADVNGANTADGADIHQWTCHSGSNQRWTLKQVDNGYYQVIAKHSGKCMGVQNSGTGNGVNVYQWSCHGGKNQHWGFTSNGNGTYRLTARHSGKVLGVVGSYGNNGASLYQWDWVGASSQIWTLERVE